ncbi:hypothetical protein G9A89_022657 [Geosiphon pyriformis]|nr:hypothetical protein G9A89_022657 [Geosiphon pyriformis]
MNKENNSEITEEESIDSENKEDKMTTYIAKISEFNGENIETSPQEWLDQVTKAEDANGWNAARIQIRQLETNDYYSNAQILDQFIAGLKNKLIKKVYPHALEDLNSAIQHAKRYKMAMEEANCTKLMNLAIEETSSAAEEKIDQLVKKSCHYYEIPGHWKRDCRKLQQDQQNRSNQHYSPPQQSYYQPPPPAYYLPRPQYQTNANLNWETQELKISYQEQHAQVPATCSTFNKCSEKAPVFEFELEEEKPIIETFMALGSTSNWANETEQQYFSTNDSSETKELVTTGWNVPYSKPEA